MAVTHSDVSSVASGNEASVPFTATQTGNAQCATSLQSHHCVFILDYSVDSCSASEAFHPLRECVRDCVCVHDCASLGVFVCDCD